MKLLILIHTLNLKECRFLTIVSSECMYLLCTAVCWSPPRISFVIYLAGLWAFDSKFKSKRWCVQRSRMLRQSLFEDTACSGTSTQPHLEHVFLLTCTTYVLPECWTIDEYAMYALWFSFAGLVARGNTHIYIYICTVCMDPFVRAHTALALSVLRCCWKTMAKITLLPGWEGYKGNRLLERQMHVVVSLMFLVIALLVFMF